MAMVLSEWGEAHPGFSFQVLATDVSSIVLARGKRGIFTEEAIRPVPAGLRKKYLMRSRDRGSGLFRVVPELRRLIEFRRLNFMDADYGLTQKVDIFFCRNVIIYFDREAKKKVIESFYHKLREGGYLLLGHSESLINISNAFVRRTLKNDMVYQKPFRSKTG